MLCAQRCARRELEAAELPVKLSQTGLSDCMKLKENAMKLIQNQDPMELIESQNPVKLMKI